MLRTSGLLRKTRSNTLLTLIFLLALPSGTFTRPALALDPIYCRITIKPDLISEAIQKKANSLLPPTFSPNDLLHALTTKTEAFFDRSVRAPTLEELREFWTLLGLSPDQLQGYQFPRKYLGQYKPYTSDLSDLLNLIDEEIKKDSVSDFLRVAFLEYKKPNSLQSLDSLVRYFELLGVSYPAKDPQLWSKLSFDEQTEQAGKFLFSLETRFSSTVASIDRSKLFYAHGAFRNSVTASLVTILTREATRSHSRISAKLLQLFRELPIQNQFTVLNQISALMRTQRVTAEIASAYFDTLALQVRFEDSRWPEFQKICADHLGQYPLQAWVPLSHFPAGNAIESIALKYPAFAEPLRDLVVSHYLSALDPNQAAQKVSILHQSLGANYKQAIQTNAKRHFKPLFTNLSPKSNQVLLTEIPELQGDFAHTLISQLELPASQAPEGLLNQVIQTQDQINAGLKDTLMDVIQSGAPPPGFSKYPAPWGAFLMQLPSDTRYEATLALLNTHATSSSSAVTLIRQIEPLPGSREAVIEFFRVSPLLQGNRTQLEPRQIREMFSPERWQAFFPLSPSLDRQGAVRTQLIFAKNAHANNNMNTAWIREKINDDDTASGAMQILGFRPIRNYGNLEAQLSSTRPVDGSISASDQARGLIVQGYYEKSSDTLMNTRRDRGADHVEDTAPSINRRLETNLSSMWLSREPWMIQQFFARAWQMNTDRSLIESIRQGAINVASRISGFWDLRVQIHNFPTAKIIAECREFLARPNLPEAVKTELESLIRRMDRFVGQNQLGPKFDDVLQSLQANDAERTRLTMLTAGIDEAPYATNMSLSKLAIKQWWTDTRANGNTAARHIPFWNAQRRILEYRLARHVAQLEKTSFSNPTDILKTATDYLPSLLDSLELEHLIDNEIRRRYEAMVQGVLAQTNLSEVRKTELYGFVIQNLLDLIYARVRKEFGRFEDVYHPIITRSTPKFTDGLLRSTSAFALGKYVDEVFAGLTDWRKITHQINGQEFRGAVEVFNPGETVGILQFNKSPMTLNKNEIGVFESMPTEMNACAGMITLGTGARLSHVQLLAKALHVPNIKGGLGLKNVLKTLDGQWVKIHASRTGKLTVSPTVLQDLAKPKPIAEIPQPNLALKGPYRFSNANDWKGLNVAGPKGTFLAQAFSDPRLMPYSEDGFVLPFGFFEHYLQVNQIAPWIKLLSQTQTKNKHLASVLSGKISAAIKSIPIPNEMLDEIIAEMESLRERTGHTGGYFFRSDTNIEDLPGFNGAGLNESVANIQIDRKQVDAAIRRVWASAFSEKSVYWRAMAVGQKQVPIAYPSVVVMPTVSAKSSGVYVSKGPQTPTNSSELISANYGIGSVVESGTAVEEITLETGAPLRYSMSVAQQKPQASASGGLQNQALTTTKFVLTAQQAKEIVKLGEIVQLVFGSAPYGWDIEWAFDKRGNLRFLQCRHNMAPNQEN